MKARISAIEFYLPSLVLRNEDLAAQSPTWTADKIEQKTGIRTRHISGPNECASDLAMKAMLLLFESGVCRAAEVDFLLLCTQSPDYFLPTTACLLQTKLSLPTTCGALDFNLGCSGYVYGLGLAKGLIESGQARNVLLVTAETYSKFIHPNDNTTRTLFGDAGAATLVEGVESEADLIGPFVFGTDGSGAENLMVATGGMRQAFVPGANLIQDQGGNQRTVNNLYMNGPEIFNFTLQMVPRAVQELLRKADRRLDQIDRFVFHQANRYMLEHLCKKLQVPREKFSLCMAESGNTVSSTIPIALRADLEAGLIHHGDTLMLVGFGVGYSWGATLLKWQEKQCDLPAPLAVTACDGDPL